MNSFYQQQCAMRGINIHFMDLFHVYVGDLKDFEQKTLKFTIFFKQK